MTLQISIIVPGDEENPTAYLEAQMAALGFVRRNTDAAAHPRQETVEQHMWMPLIETPVRAMPALRETEQTVKRERGKPCPLSGRKRRTREEVEEDEAAEAAEQATIGQLSPEPNHARTIAQVLGQEAEYDAEFGDKQQISTGEERVDPASEPEQTVEPVAEPKTLEDVKKALGAYVTAFGMAAAQTDGQQIFREALGEPPAGEQAWRMTLIPNDEAKYGAVVAAVYGAIELNPYKRERVA